ncbi:MAG: hypothetical protein AAB354_05165, partial [candidate division KSB1 bacterium]
MSLFKKEKPDAILLGFGGQTALNCGLALAQAGVFEKHNVKVLGTPISAIRDTEDRHLFCERLREIDVKTPHSLAVNSKNEAVRVAQDIGYP